MKLTTPPIIKNVWARIRLRKILRRREEVAVFWRPIIQQYFEENIEHYNVKPQKADIANKKIIWQ